METAKLSSKQTKSRSRSSRSKPNSNQSKDKNGSKQSKSRSSRSKYNLTFYPSELKVDSPRSVIGSDSYPHNIKLDISQTELTTFKPNLNSTYLEEDSLEKLYKTNTSEEEQCYSDLNFDSNCSNELNSNIINSNKSEISFNFSISETSSYPSETETDSSISKDIELISEESELFSNHSDLIKAQFSSLFNTDPELYLLLFNENNRQIEGINLIASENITSYSVLECLGSCLQNKYSEGYPGKRYYGGNKYIDEVELLCQKRALELYNLDPNIWGVNVQAYSGSPANFAIYTAICGKGGRIMGLDLPDGGHLTHGFASPTKKVSCTSLFFESMPYKIDPKTGLIDYELLEKMSSLFKPNIIIAGVSAYPRLLDYKRFRDICDKNNSYLLSDMSHIAGLVAAKIIPSPFEYSDIVSTTTHKTLRGPRGALIFYKKELEAKINNAVFPGLQGGPHNNNIAGITTALKEASTSEFILYQKQVIYNAKILANELIKLGYNVITGGTDTHIILLDVSILGINGAEAEKRLENNNIYVNKNTLPGDKSVLKPSGLRLGTPTITTRGMDDMAAIANFIDRALKNEDIKKEVITFSKSF